MLLQNLFRQRNRKNGSRGGGRRPRRLAIEGLEVRQLLSLGSPLATAPACAPGEIGFDQDTSQLAEFGMRRPPVPGL